MDIFAIKNEQKLIKKNFPKVFFSQFFRKN